MAHDEFSVTSQAQGFLPPAPPKPQPAGGRLIRVGSRLVRVNVEPRSVEPANASLVEMVRDAVAGAPSKTEPQAAVLAVARWLRSVGNCGSASELEREATK